MAVSSAARRARAFTGPPSEQLEEKAAERELTAIEAASGFLGQFAGVADLTVIVQRRHAESGKWQHIKSVALDTNPDEESIRKQYGAGSYRLIVRGPKTDANPQGYYGQHTMELADLSDGARPPETRGGGMDDLTKILLSQNMALIAGLTGGQRSNAPAVPGLSEIIGAVKDMAAMSGAKAPEADPMAVVNKMLGFHLRMRELEGAAADERPPENPYAEVLKELGPRTLGVLEAVVGKRPVAEAGVQPAPVPQLAAGTPEYVGKLVPFFPSFVSLAKIGASAELTVAMIYEKAPADVLDTLEDAALASETWEDDFLKSLPPSQLRDQYGAWARGVLVALKQRLTQDKAEREAEEGQGVTAIAGTRKKKKKEASEETGAPS